VRASLVALVSIMVAVAAAVWLFRTGQIEIPPRFNPWAPLDIEAAPNFLTRFKLARLEGDPGLCLATLAGTPMRFRALPDREIADGCRLHNAVTIVSAEVPLDAPLTLSCPASVALAVWERHSVQPAATRWLGARVTRIETFGSYACRNIYGRENAPLSEHATANALDVAGFVLANGHRVRVANDWHGDSSASRFLREVDADACRYFDAVLDPDYNAAHHDHLHLDRGPYRFCR
jgi:hypothetical protein